MMDNYIRIAYSSVCIDSVRTLKLKYAYISTYSVVAKNQE